MGRECSKIQRREKGIDMTRFTLMAIFAGLITFGANAATEDIVYDNFQTIYTETPVQSYYAYPDDPNFIPETEFMNRADSLDYDLNIEEARQIFDNVLHNTATEGQKNVVLANAAFAIKVIESDKPVDECLDIARTSLESGRALEIFNRYVSINQTDL